jgi:drug/metabolite transporter (DMT)-like permease
MLGASMWGLETYWRVTLSRHFEADVLVFHEHWVGLALTLPLLVLGRSQLVGVPAKAWAAILLSGVLGSALGTIAFTRALALLNPSVANLLLNVQPVVSVLVSWAWLGERPRGAFWPWAAVALACGLALGWPMHTLPGGAPTGWFTPAEVLEAFRASQLGTGLLAIAATAFCWGASTTFGRGAMLHIDTGTGVALRYLIGTVATFVVVAIRGLSGARLNASALTTWPVARDLGTLLLVAALTPTFLYFAGLARTKASVATFAEMGQTLASLLVTWGVMGFGLSPAQFVAGTFLLVAVGFIHRSMEAAERSPDVGIALE